MNSKPNPEYADKIDKQINEILMSSKAIINTSSSDKNYKTPTFNNSGQGQTPEQDIKMITRK
jgi:hypothetical protein